MTVKMGLRCFLLVFVMIHCSFALSCRNVFKVDKTTCDVCIRCGGLWCSDPAEPRPCQEKIRAVDGWCKNHRENPTTVDPNTKYGAVYRPQHEENLAEINAGKITEIEFIGHLGLKSGLVPYHHVNTTQPSGETKVDITYKMTGNIIEVTTVVKDGFCSENSREFEYVFVEVGIRGVSEKSVLKYHVPCACGCTEKVEVDSPTCHGYGNLTCGSCQCNDYRKGKHCEICPDRGDTSSSCTAINEVQCSGNGYCDECSKCHCYNETQIPGSQYFNPDDNCMDICSTVNGTECLVDCLKDNKEGNCREACTPNVLERWNETLLEQEFDAYRSLWVKCIVYIEQESLEYWATKVNTNIHIMRKEFSESAKLIPVPEGNGVTIPVVIGVVAAIAAAVAAAVGYVMWKGQGALPTAGSNYANIDPEDSVGVNPLYKPPTSSFKNPMYAAKS